MTDDRRPNSTDDPESDLLNRATAALRHAPVPDGPPAETVAGTVSTLSTLAAIGRRSVPRPSPFRPFGLPARIAAVVLLAVCGVAAALAAARHFGVPTSLVVQNPGPTVPTSPNKQPPATPPAPATASAAPIRGRVVFDGPPPPPRPVTSPLLEHCDTHGPVVDDTLVVGPDRGLANVVVSIKSGLPADRPYSSPPAAAVLDQSGCVFEPHVVAMRVGQALVARNGDPFLHNVHTLPKPDPVGNVAANIGQPTVDRRGLTVGQVRAPEIFKVKCDVHPWMSAWVAAFDHPYFAVTRPDGTFALPDLPPGRYVVRAWHEQLGVVDKPVVVSPGHPAALDFTFAPAHAATVPDGDATDAAATVLAFATNGTGCGTCGPESEPQ